MGKATALKEARKEQREARKGKIRLQAVKIEGQIVAYDEHGRATSKGSGALEPVFLMEDAIPQGVIDVIREKFPKLDIEIIDPGAGPKPA